MNEEKQIKQYNRPRGALPDTEQGWADYRAQRSELQKVADEERELDRAMDAQHQAREEGTDIIDDMDVREMRAR